MTYFTIANYVTTEADLDRSNIVDLDLVTLDGVQFLISTTLYDGVLTSWQIGDGLLAQLDQIAFDAPARAGATGTLVDIALDGGAGLLSGGGTGGALQTITLQNDGRFGLATDLTAVTGDLGGLQSVITVPLSGGAQAVYGGLPGEAGLGMIVLDAAGAITAQSVVTSVAGVPVGQIAGFTVINNTLFAADQTNNSLTSWTIGADGNLSAPESFGTEQNLWISTPTVVTHVSVAGVDYLLLGAAGSNSLSVIEVGTDGSLTIRDHVIDSRDSRFEGITALETVTHQGKTYVIAGGADDGLTAFTLLEGGMLVPLGTVADTTLMGLQNISAIAASGTGNGLDLYVASSSETGVTHLRFDTGIEGATVTADVAGSTLAGTAGRDILQGLDGRDDLDGGAGDDILRDGAGADTLTGGAGADIFIMTADGETDVITDFTFGQDSLDLSLWPLLRDVSQLTFSIQSYGIDIVYGDERLVVQMTEDGPFDYRLLTNADILPDVTRIGSVIEPGFPGPPRPAPPLNPQQRPDRPETENNMLDGISVVAGGSFADLGSAASGLGTASSKLGTAGAANGLLEGTGGNNQLTGNDGVDFLAGGNGRDRLTGNDGADFLFGHDGNDTLDGGADGDLLVGGNGNDVLLGGSGNDTLIGGEGRDRLESGLGDDLMLGGGGIDTFVFNGGTDVIGDFQQGADKILLDPVMYTGLQTSADVVLFHGSIDGDRATLDFGDAGVLHIDGVTDYDTLAADILLF